MIQPKTTYDARPFFVIRPFQFLSRDTCMALVCATVLALYGNGMNALAWRTSGKQRNMVTIIGTLSMLASVLVWHRRVDCCTLDQLGCHTRQWRRGILLGSLAGTAMAVPPLCALMLPLLRSTPLKVDEINRVSRAALLVRLLITMPILVALTEEIVFRGFVQGKLQRALPEQPVLAVGLSSLSFALWHVVVNVRTLQESNVVRGGIASQPFALLIGLLGVFTGGLIFGGLYQRTGSLIAPTLAHWLVNVLMQLAITYPPVPDYAQRWLRRQHGS